jgi:hypothetical protein
MWIVRVALSRPYTFIVLAIMILIAAPVVIFRTPSGLNPEEMEGRLTGCCTKTARAP